MYQQVGCIVILIRLFLRCKYLNGAVLSVAVIIYRKALITDCDIGQLVIWLH